MAKQRESDNTRLAVVNHDTGFTLRLEHTRYLSDDSGRTRRMVDYAPGPDEIECTTVIWERLSVRAPDLGIEAKFFHARSCRLYRPIGQIYCVYLGAPSCQLEAMQHKSPPR